MRFDEENLEMMGGLARLKDSEMPGSPLPMPAPSPIEAAQPALVKSKMPEFDLEKLKAEQESMNSTKNTMGIIGALGDILGSRQSFGNFYSGKMNPQSTSGARTASMLSANMTDPMEREKKAMAYLEAKNKAKSANNSQAYIEKLKDDSSPQSKAFKASLISNGVLPVEDIKGVSAFDLYSAGYSPSKISEIKAKSQIDLENDMQKIGVQKDADYAREMAKIRASNEERRLNKLDADALKSEAKAEKELEKRKERETLFGVARTPDDAKKLKEASEMKSKLDAQINELIALRESKGAEVLDRDAVGRAKQLSKDLLLTKKNLENLGVLSQSDRDIVNEIIPDDPLQFNMSQLFGQDPTLTKLKAFRSDTNRDFEERLKNRLENYQGPQNAGLSPADEQAMKWAMSNQNDPRAQKIMDGLKQKAMVGKK